MTEPPGPESVRPTSTAIEAPSKPTPVVTDMSPDPVAAFPVAKCPPPLVPSVLLDASDTMPDPAVALAPLATRACPPVDWADLPPINVKSPDTSIVPPEVTATALATPLSPVSRVIRPDDTSDDADPALTCPDMDEPTFE